ncbi:uncharacterized protein LY79DRAFT_3018 [Colletotrichum navitas]|uniref:Uncharacterized protein n=1 Tax=Colletotrichum navitas TaxID=681940 RepID=A0AAD8QEQ0_9PEZI|nr:uncharacterized protein LY79DRAFT_3018 [Colletotrichum navitas]KAK1599983.1 hypothetical protein LY79DRAFT_3018 [Colletotrichum navitas]
MPVASWIAGSWTSFNNWTVYTQGSLHHSSESAFPSFIRQVRVHARSNVTLPIRPAIFSIRPTTTALSLSRVKRAVVFRLSVFNDVSTYTDSWACRSMPDSKILAAAAPTIHYRHPLARCGLSPHANSHSLATAWGNGQTDLPGGGCLSQWKTGMASVP